MVVPLAAEVVVHPLPASRYAEVGARVDQELPFTVLSVTKKQPVLVERTCAASDVSCVHASSGSPMWVVECPGRPRY
jgi:hypothetical protein